MRYVVAVARERNFTHAALQLHVAQQALSQQVRAVETMLGVQLFDRAARPVKLTPAGMVFVQEAKRALSASDRVVERTHAAARGELGTIRLAYTFAIAYETLPAVLEAFAEDTPRVNVVAREMFGADMPLSLREGRLDIALTPRFELGEDLARRSIRRERFIVALPEDHPLATQPRIDLTQLRSETFQIWPPAVSPGFHAAVVAACHTAGFDPQVDETASGSTAWRHIAAGRGVALVVASAVPQLPRGIALAELSAPDTHITLDAVWPRDGDLPAVKRFVDTAIRVAGERGWLSGRRPTLPRSSRRSHRSGSSRSCPCAN
jgi:DNA-binding transcriptional LysR family regulator